MEGLEFLLSSQECSSGFLNLCVCVCVCRLPHISKQFSDTSSVQKLNSILTLST